LIGGRVQLLALNCDLAFKQRASFKPLPPIAMAEFPHQGWGSSFLSSRRWREPVHCLPCQGGTVPFCANHHLIVGRGGNNSKSRFPVVDLGSRAKQSLNLDVGLLKAIPASGASLSQDPGARCPDRTWVTYGFGASTVPFCPTYNDLSKTRQ